MFNILSRPPMYDQDAVQPMRDELLAVGFKELLTPEQVDEAINVKDEKTVLVMINSVCGCAAVLKKARLVCAASRQKSLSLSAQRAHSS